MVFITHQVDSFAVVQMNKYLATDENARDQGLQLRWIMRSKACGIDGRALIMSDDHKNFVLEIYDTVADQSLWPGVLDKIADKINALGCMVFEWESLDNRRSLTVPHASSFYKKEVINHYVNKFFEHEARDQDIFEAHSLASDGVDLIDDRVLASSRRELEKLENVQQLLKFGICHRAAGLLNKDNTAQSRFSVQFKSDRGRMTGSERAYLGDILPHVAKALDLGRPAAQLAREHTSLLQAMDELNIGVCILDNKGSLALGNQEFQRQLDSFQAFRVDPNGRLRMSDQLEQHRYSALLSDALNHGKFGARPRKEAITADSENFLCIEVVPLDTADEIGSKSFGGYVLYSTDTSRPVSCNPQPLQRAFDLTDAELGLVQSLGQGLTNAQIAERRDRAVSTINAQVKSILAKSHCSTRTRFVRLMMNFGAEILRES